jgi:hypothetical protein
MAPNLVGNDLITARPEFRFPGLRPADRWEEACEANIAPSVVLEATQIGALEFLGLEKLESHAVSS